MSQLTDEQILRGVIALLVICLGVLFWLYLQMQKNVQNLMNRISDEVDPLKGKVKRLEEWQADLKKGLKEVQESSDSNLKMGLESVLGTLEKAATAVEALVHKVKGLTQDQEGLKQALTATQGELCQVKNEELKAVKAQFEAMVKVNNEIKDLLKLLVTERTEWLVIKRGYGNTYEGYCKNGIPHGEGREYDKSSYNSSQMELRYEGMWKDGKRDGPGKQFHDGDVYFEGIWKDGQKWDGKGMDGKRNTTIWKEGKEVIA
jgi:outer membrane murein-binding lipoprotein Lpp